MKKAVVLLSGGMDSAVTLYLAKREYDPYVLIFDYGQKAEKEIGCAKKLCDKAGCDYHIMDIDLPWKGSSLLDDDVEVPSEGASSDGKIPTTYVPSRNIIFLSFATSYAEAIGAEAVFIGAHQLDYSNYPDCRSEFFESFRKTVELGTKKGVEEEAIRVVTPIINMTKKEILEAGTELGVPFEDTWSCYKQQDSPCRSCESCVLREKAFTEAGIKDPLRDM